MRISSLSLNLHSGECEIEFEHNGARRTFQFVAEQVVSLGGNVIQTPVEFYDFAECHYETGAVPELVGTAIRAARSLAATSIHLRVEDGSYVAAVLGDGGSHAARWAVSESEIIRDVNSIGESERRNQLQTLELEQTLRTLVAINRSTAGG